MDCHQGPAGPRRVLLVGMMGAGKSTVAQRLGRPCLGWPLVDTDDIVEATGRHDVGRLFAVRPGRTRSGLPSRRR